MDKNKYSPLGLTVQFAFELWDRPRQLFAGLILVVVQTKNCNLCMSSFNINYRFKDDGFEPRVSSYPIKKGI